MVDTQLLAIFVIAMVAGIILFRLYAVLGRRTGQERPPPENFGLPGDGAMGEARAQLQAVPNMRPSDPLAAGLLDIQLADRGFDKDKFLAGARGAYEMIVLAFANGDRRSLKDLLSGEVYDSFDAAIKDRERQELKTETRFVSIDKAEIVGAEARERNAQLTVRFVSQMISVTRDKAGAIVDGNPDKVADITDVWTFARDPSSRDPNWKLVGTGSAH